MKKLLRPGLLIFSGICLLVSCAKEYSLETGSGGTPATGLLVKDAQNNCLPATIHGTYNAGVDANDSNYVEVTVTINKPGTYYITTDQQNGLSFADSGYFSIIGTRTVKLGAIGTPILPITTDFTVLFDTSYCAFSVNVSDGTGSIADPNKNDSAWRFEDASRIYAGRIDTAYFSAANGDTLLVSGFTPATSDTSFALALLLPTARTLTPGSTYSTTSATAPGAGFVFHTSTPTSTDIYQANPVSGGNVTITITGWDATTRILDGIFNGPAINSSGGSTTLTNGKFRIRIAS